MRLLLAIVLLPSLAIADPDPERRELDEWLEKVTFGRGGYTNTFAWSANASVTGQAGRDTGVKTSAAGEVAWVVGYCKALFLGGAGARDKEWSGSAWGGFCVPFPKLRLETTIRSDYQLQPSFAALPIALRSRYESTTISVNTTIVFEDDGPIDHEVFALDQFTVGMFDQDRLENSYLLLSIDLAMYRWHDTETGRAIRAAPFELRSAEPVDPYMGQSSYWSANALGVAPVGLTKWPVGTVAGFAVDVDAMAGLAYAWIDNTTGPMTNEVVHRDADVFVDTAIRATRGDDVLALTARRAFEPTYVDQLLLDSRTELSWTHTRGANTFAAKAFAARTEHIDRSGTVDSEPTGGVRAAYVRRFGPAQLTLAAEAARSFFAKLDDTVAVDARWAAQTSASLSIAK